MKTCFKCGQDKDRSCFYRHPQMGDGLLGKCKECTKEDVRKARATAPRAREYDIKRAKTASRRAEQLARQKRLRALHPEKSYARAAVARAVKAGLLNRQPCLVCKNPKVEAHHEDHSKPLEVIWLCALHHRRHEFGKPVKGLTWAERMAA